MQKFRRKPTEIMAKQFNPGMGQGWPPGVRSPQADGRYVITIGSSEIDVIPGDWITYSEHGHGVGVVRDDYFRREYDPI